MFSKFMNFCHPIFAWLNAAICVGDVIQGDAKGALISGAIAAVLFWQMTW